MLHYITLCYITLHYITLHYIASHYVTLHHITLRHITLHYITLHYIMLHYITLHYITLHYITLHYITLHYITLHSQSFVDKNINNSISRVTLRITIFSIMTLRIMVFLLHPALKFLSISTLSITAIKMAFCVTWTLCWVSKFRHNAECCGILHLLKKTFKLHF